jgi:hypothetical protein
VIVAGGETMDGGPLASVEFATLDSQTADEGFNLGDFTTIAGSSLLEARTGLGAAATETFFYVFGGGGANGAPLATVERAPIQPGGLGAFEAVATSHLVTPRRYFSTVQAGGFVYVVGGQGADDAPVDSIERAPLGEDGSLGAFEVVGYLEVPRYKAAIAGLEGEFALAGGMTAEGVTRDVEVQRYQALLPGATPRPSASPTPSASPSAAPTATATATPTPAATATPTASPTPSATPTATATP